MSEAVAVAELTRPTRWRALIEMELRATAGDPDPHLPSGGVVFVTGGTFMAGDWWRVIIPEWWLARQGVATSIANVKATRTVGRLLYEGHLTWLAPITWNLGPHLAAFKARGNRLVLYVDDDMWHPTPWNPRPPGQTRQGEHAFLERQLLAADAVIATTPELARLAGRGCRHVYEVPHGTLPLAELPVSAVNRRTSPAAFRVGWAGGGTHQGDLAHLERPLADLAERMGDALALVFMGDVPAWAKVRGLRYTRVPWQDSYVDYLETLAAQRLDVLLAPLDGHRFNESKSHCKALEAWATGPYPFVASDVGPYGRVLRHLDTAWLVNNAPAAWAEALTTLRDQPELRARLASNGRCWLADHGTIDTTGPRWAEALGVTVTA